MTAAERDFMPPATPKIVVLSTDRSRQRIHRAICMASMPWLFSLKPAPIWIEFLPPSSRKSA
jgi:hypothetical protein